MEIEGGRGEGEEVRDGVREKGGVERAGRG